MAKAGDGAPRSSQRRQTDRVDLRCTPYTKAGWQRRARRAGYDTLSTWIKDIIRTHDTVSLRLRETTCGQLGQIGARVTGLLSPSLSADLTKEITALAADIAQVQLDLITGGRDAGGSD